MKHDRDQGSREAKWLEESRRKIEEGWQEALHGELLESAEVFDELKREIESLPGREREPT